MTTKKKNDGAFEQIFARHPEVKEGFEKYLQSVPKHQREQDFQKCVKFVEGELSWSEIKEIPKTLLKELARIAHFKYKMGDYQTAETLFKGLSIIDHFNWYYRTALGAIYQKQGLFNEAIEEYTMAITLNEEEIIALSNRGECHVHLKNNAAALQDFEAAIRLGAEKPNAWSKRAAVLKAQLMKGGSPAP